MLLSHIGTSLCVKKVTLKQMSDNVVYINFCLCGHGREYHEQWYYISSRHIDITGRCMYSIHNRSCPCNNFTPLNKGRISSILKTP